MNRKERRAILEYCGARRKTKRMQILASIMLNGHNAASIANSHKITPQSVSKVICGLMHTPRILDMLRAAGAKEQDLFDPARMLAAKCKYTTKELALLLDKPVATILRWAKRESWTGEKRKGKGGGMEWHTLSLPEYRRKSLAIVEQVNNNGR